MSVSSNNSAARQCRAAVTLAAAVVLTVLVAGCGSDDDPVAPDGISLLPDATRLQVTRTMHVEAVNTYPGARDDAPACDWYVDDVPGGNAMVGTITQTNPATFTAPPAVPAGGVVEIKAVSRENESFTSSLPVDIVFTIRYVDGAVGTDTSSGGAWTNPLRTITYALDLVSEGDTLFVLPGSYDPDHGEAGDFFIPGGVALVGASTESCLIFGSGSDFNVLRLGDGATLENVTVGNWDQDQMAVLSTGSGWVRGVAVSDLFEYCAVRADGGRLREGNDVTIQDCVLVSGAGSTDDGTAIETLNGTHCSVRDCTISGWRYGIYVNRNSDPLVEGNTITGNDYGVVAAGTGDPLTGPDLGGGARSSSGGNVIRDNVSVGVQNITVGAIWALNNTWTTDPPTEGPPTPADFINVIGGTVIWTR